MAEIQRGEVDGLRWSHPRTTGFLGVGALTVALALGAMEARAAGVCGDGVMDPGEQCDDGNTLSDDGCSATCESECLDSDHEGVCDLFDDCPFVPNPFQVDSNGNGVGDACDVTCLDVVDDGDTTSDSTHPATNYGLIQTMNVQSRGVR